MDGDRRQKYEKISREITKYVGGRENIRGVAHCATRLRLVLHSNELADLKAVEGVDLVKGVFVAGDMVQIIFGAGLVNDVCEVFAEYNHMTDLSVSDLKTAACGKGSPLKRILKALSDVFVDIMPGILAAALLTGLSGVMGNMDFVQENATLYGMNRLINISSGAIFGFLPLAVAYSACRQFGGRPILGIVTGCIMLSDSLANAYAAAQGTVEVSSIYIFGLEVELVGFQGGIIVALLMGVVTAKLDRFFEKKIPEVIRLLVSPLFTTLVGALLLFTVIGPVGRGLATAITGGLMWMTQNLGMFGYAVFAGLQQLVVITGLHHIFEAVEAQLLADTGRNFLNPLMSVAVIAQGGAVLGCLVRRREDAGTRELGIPAFVSVLFGITEPALFGVNLRYHYPVIGGCIGGAMGGVVVYLTNLAAAGFGTTVIPGIALADPAGNGYVNYIIAHTVAIAGGFLTTLLLGCFVDRRQAALPEEVADTAGHPTDTAGQSTDAAGQPTDTAEHPTDTAGHPTDTAGHPTDTAGKPTDAAGKPTNIAEQPTDTAEQPTDTTGQSTAPQESETEKTGKESGEETEEVFFGYAEGLLTAVEEVSDETFAGKVLGDGTAVMPVTGKVYAPADGTVVKVLETGHALCFVSGQGTEILIHIGVDTVKLQGKHFTPCVSDGEAVKQGQLLIDFDREQIEKAGYDTVVLMIFPNLPEETLLEKAKFCRVTRETRTVVIRRKM